MRAALLLIVAVAFTVGACAKKPAPVARPIPPPPPMPAEKAPAPPRPPERIAEPIPVPPEPVPEDAVGSKSLDDLNRDSPLKPVFFELDSAELSSASQGTLQENANVLKKYATWQITIEGHCDERGSAEYNLALGERRANAVKEYLVGLGIAADRLLVVSKGEETPVCSEESEAGYSRNRRAHSIVTAK